LPPFREQRRAGRGSLRRGVREIEARSRTGQFRRADGASLSEQTTPRRAGERMPVARVGLRHGTPAPCGPARLQRWRTQRSDAPRATRARHAVRDPPCAARGPGRGPRHRARGGRRRAELCHPARLARILDPRADQGTSRRRSRRRGHRTAGPATGSDMTTRTQPNGPQSSRNGEVARHTYLPLAAAAVLGVACHKAESYVRPPVPVRASTVRQSPQTDQELRFSGTVAPEAEIELSFKVGGYATSLRTPVDALVLARSVEIGNLISPNTVAFRLADVSRIKVRFAVADGVASRLQIGSPVTVTADAVEAKLPAVISKLHPQSSSDA